MLCSYSTLDARKLEAIKSYESKIGKRVLAYDCRQAQPAKLDAKQEEELKKLEKELGVVLVAYE